MTGPDLKAIRDAHGLSLYEFGQALGYTSTRRTIKNLFHRYETRNEPVPPKVVLRLIELGWYKPQRRKSA